MVRIQHSSAPAERPIRFGILDCVSALVLFGMHIGALKSMLLDRFGKAEPDRMVAAAVLALAFAFGAAYLAFRFATSKKITSFGWRLLALVIIDAGLIAIPLTIYRERTYGVLPLMLIIALLVWTLVQSKLNVRTLGTMVPRVRIQHSSAPADRPIRFGILDMVAALMLFGIHIGTLKSKLIDLFGTVETDRMVAAAVLGSTFAFGAAYLAFRYATSKRITSYGWRLLTLVIIDGGLVSIPLVIFLASTGVVLPLMVTAIATPLVWVVLDIKLEQDAR